MENVVRLGEAEISLADGCLGSIRITPDRAPHAFLPNFLSFPFCHLLHAPVFLLPTPLTQWGLGYSCTTWALGKKMPKKKKKERERDKSIFSLAPSHQIQVQGHFSYESEEWPSSQSANNISWIGLVSLAEAWPSDVEGHPGNRQALKLRCRSCRLPVCSKFLTPTTGSGVSPNHRVKENTHCSLDSHPQHFCYQICRIFFSHANQVSATSWMPYNPVQFWFHKLSA